MSKKYLNTLSIKEIKERLYKGEKIFNDTDKDAYVRYVPEIGICKFQRNTDKLLAINLTLTLFSQLYFNDLKEDYESMIGCVGWFDGCEDEIKLGILTKVAPNDEDGYCFLRNNNIWCKSFRPAKKSELKYWGED